MLSIVVFVAMVVAAITIDLRFHPRGAAVTLRQAAKWSLFYVAVALAYAGWLLVSESGETASLFLTGYTLEKVLSVDNLFAFTLVFSYFGVKPEHRYRILRWGVLGAIVFRLLFVTLGSVAMLFGRISEVVFGVIIALSAIKMLRGEESTDAVDHNSRWYMRSARWLLHVSDDVDSGRIFIRDGWRIRATPLFFCLVAIEATDVVFSFDSVPTVIAVSRRPLIIYSSMVFAILGLRALYFVIEALKSSLVHLGKAVVVILVFIAAKLVLRGLLGWDMPPGPSLAIVMLVLGGGVLWSLACANDARNGAQP